MSQLKHLGSFIIKSGTATFSSGGLFNTMCPVIDHVKCVPGTWNIYSEGVLGRHLFCHQSINAKNFDLNGTYSLLGRHKFDMWVNTLRISDPFHLQESHSTNPMYNHKDVFIKRNLPTWFAMNMIDFNLSRPEDHTEFRASTSNCRPHWNGSYQNSFFLLQEANAGRSGRDQWTIEHRDSFLD